MAALNFYNCQMMLAVGFGIPQTLFIINSPSSKWLMCMRTILHQGNPFFPFLLHAIAFLKVEEIELGLTVLPFRYR